MGKYIARRLLQFIPVFIGATFIIFYMVYTLPGDPIRALGGERPMSQTEIQVLTDRYNLDDNLPVQYLKYVGVMPQDSVAGEDAAGFDGVLQGNFGQTFTQREVSDIIAQRLPITFRLAIVAFVFEMILGIIAGVVAGVRKGSYIDNLVLVSTIAVISVPSLVLGFVAQLVFGVRLGWFTINAAEGTFTALLLPGFVLGALSLAYIARLTRTSLVENLRADYVRTATSKGLERRSVIGKHALRNSLIPVVTFLGVDIGQLMAGAVVTEGIFNVPGLGQAVFRAISNREPAVVVGIVTFFVLVYMLASLIVDIMYAALDPRIRYE